MAPADEVTILGGGPAGLATAFYAHRSGLSFSLFERSSELGGLCRTFRLGEHGYDSGAHRFHDRDAEVTRDVRELLGDALVSVKAPSQILHRGRFIDFPPGPLTWLRGEGVPAAARSAVEILAGRLRPRPERSFEDVAVNRYGRRLAQPLLIEYSEKLWGLPARELAPDAATRRLSGLALKALLIELFLPGRRSAHLDGAFLYPRPGYGAICDGLAAALPKESVHLEHEVLSLHVEEGRVRLVAFKGRAPLAVAGRLVSTLPLTGIARLLGASLPEAAQRAAERLRFRHIRLVFLRLSVPRCTANATIYLPDPALAVSRVFEPKNRSIDLAPRHETALVAEVPCSTGDPVWQMDDAALAGRVIAELSGVGLMTAAMVLDQKVHLLANAYPVYALDSADARCEVSAALASITNLDLLGRGGRFWYSHLHDQMRSAKDYAESFRKTRANAPRSMS
jgi:protoporphyrinogen oxidase